MHDMFSSIPELEAHMKLATIFGDKLYRAFGVNETEGRELWAEFVSSFRPHSIQTWPKVLAYK